MKITKRARISYPGLRLWLRIKRGVRMRLPIGIGFSLPFFGSLFNDSLRRLYFTGEIALKIPKVPFFFCFFFVFFLFSRDLLEIRRNIM